MPDALLPPAPGSVGQEPTPIAFIPCRPQGAQPYGEINGYCLGRLAPELRRHYRPGGAMAPNSWIFLGAPAEVPRGVARP